MSINKVVISSLYVRKQIADAVFELSQMFILTPSVNVVVSCPNAPSELNSASLCTLDASTFDFLIKAPITV